LNVNPGRRKTFSLELSAVYEYVATEYEHWYDHIDGRIGRDQLHALWNSAFERFDSIYLRSILSSGWERPSAKCDYMDPDRSFDGILRVLFAPHQTGIEKDSHSDPDRLGLIRESFPLPQLRELLEDGPLQRLTTTHEAIHLYCHGLALMAECLVERFGMEGALMVYDIRLEEVAATDFRRLSVADFINRRREKLTSIPKKYDMHSAGLQSELVSYNDSEIVSRTTECEWVRYYKERHPTVGYLMCCSVDHAAYRAINGKLRLERTKTLMDGGDFCDFRIYSDSGAGE